MNAFVGYPKANNNQPIPYITSPNADIKRIISIDSSQSQEFEISKFNCKYSKIVNTQFNYQFQNLYNNNILAPTYLPSWNLKYVFSSETSGSDF